MQDERVIEVTLLVKMNPALPLESLIDSIFIDADVINVDASEVKDENE